MNMPSHVDEQPPTEITSIMGFRTRIALGAFLAIAAYFLLTEHWEHVWPLWPFLFLLACPLMHVFMHHGHAGHGTAQDTHADHPQTPGSASQGGSQ